MRKSLKPITDALSDNGVYWEYAHMGGNCWSLGIGEQNDDGYYRALFGPIMPMVDSWEYNTKECFISSDQNQESEPFTVDDSTSLEKIVETLITWRD